jgi:hypothetical protein
MSDGTLGEGRTSSKVGVVKKTRSRVAEGDALRAYQSRARFSEVGATYMGVLYRQSFTKESLRKQYKNKNFLDRSIMKVQICAAERHLKGCIY